MAAAKQHAIQAPLSTGVRRLAATHPRDIVTVKEDQQPRNRFWIISTIVIVVVLLYDLAVPDSLYARPESPPVVWIVLLLIPYYLFARMTISLGGPIPVKNRRALVALSIAWTLCAAAIVYNY